MAARGEAESALARVDALERDLARLAVDADRHITEGADMEMALRRQLSGAQAAASEAAASAAITAECLTTERDAATTELSDARSTVARLRASEMALRSEALTAQETRVAEGAVAERRIEQLTNTVMSLTSASEAAEMVTTGREGDTKVKL